MKIAGLTDVTEYEDSFAGSKDDPVLIGQKMTVRVRVAEDGTVLPRRENSDDTTPPATSILTIEVIPSIEFDSSGDPHVVWNGHASQVDVDTARVITSSLSGPSREDDEALQAERPHHEYADDPAYKDAMLAKMARSPAEAVTQALAPLVGSGRMNIGREERVPTDPPAPTTATTPPPAPTPRASGRGCVMGALGVALVLVAAGVLALLLLRDSGTPSPETTTEVESPAPTPPPASDDPLEDAGSPEPTDEQETADEQETTDDEAAEGATGVQPGMYELAGRVDSPCGGVYDVFLRIVLFLNGEATIEQLLTPGGNAFQSARGFWNPFLVAATGLQPDFFEVWLLRLVGEAFAVYNVYGPSAAAVTEGGAADLDQYADVDSSEGLLAAAQASEGSCATQLLDVTTTFTPFPGETAVG